MKPKCKFGVHLKSDSNVNKANLSNKVQVFANLKQNLQTEVK